MDRRGWRCEPCAVVKLAIICHPCTPAPTGDLEDWLEGQLDRLRKAAPQGIIRLSRLAQELPDTEIEVGWLVELELPEQSILIWRDGLADTLADFVTDMRFLGLQPRVLTPNEFSEQTSAHPASHHHRDRLNVPVLDYPGLK